MGHDHGSAAAGHRGRLALVLVISLTILVVEAIGSAIANSLALLADAGHVLTDVMGLALALAAIWFAQRPATNGRTYGYLRLEILAAVTNAFLLIGIAAFVLFEAWQRLSEPPDIASGAMLAFAVVGLAANLVSLLLLRNAQKESLNMRGAYLEVMGDLAGSIAVIVAAVVIAVTGWTGADIVASVLIGLLILPRTFSLLRDATNVLLEATPKGVDMDHVRQHGILLAIASLAVMWWLAREKRRIGTALGSRAMTADAFQTDACFWLSLFLLVGIGANALFGWWWPTRSPRSG